MFIFCGQSVRICLKLKSFDFFNQEKRHFIEVRDNAKDCYFILQVKAGGSEGKRKRQRQNARQGAGLLWLKEPLFTRAELAGEPQCHPGKSTDCRGSLIGQRLKVARE